jgi:cell division protein FtsW (lipid II flippase)
MMIATVNDSVPIFLFSFLGVFLCAAPVLWATWTLRGSRRELGAAAVLTATLAIALVAGEQSPAWLLLPAGAVVAAIFARRRLGLWGRRAVAALIVGAGLPLYALTALGFLIAVASIGCAPDAYECPF